MNVPDIITKGGEWFAGWARASRAARASSASRATWRSRACYELPMGIPFRDLIYDVCGGIPSGRKLKGVIPGGSSMPPLDASELDVPIEFDALMTDPRIKDVEVKPGVPFDLGGGRKLKTMAGSGGVVVFDDSTDVVALCARIMEFYAHESCGQCTPCREGTGWLARVCKRLARGEGEPGDVELLANIANGIGGNTICALGDAAAWPMLGFLTKFRADFEAKLAQSAKAAPRRAAGEAERMNSAAGRAALDRRAGRLLRPGRAGGGLRALHHHPPQPGDRGDVAGGHVLRAGRIYATLSAHFLAVLQVLVYAGAIMVLFIFVVMILNREEVAPLSLAAAAPARRRWRASICSSCSSTSWRSALPTAGRAARRRRHASARSPPSAICCSATSSIRSRRSRCCCWWRSWAASSSRARTRRRSPPTRRRLPQADRRAGQHDYPGVAEDEPRAAGGHHYAMPTDYYLILSFVLFLIGTAGVLLRRNALIVLMGIELQLNGGNLALLAFSRQLGDQKGHVFAFLIIALAAAEAAVGLAILVGLFRSRQTVNLDEATLMKR